jgi:aminoglycoside 6'-N-acetyltransferase
MESTLHGAMVSLRPASADDVPALARIRATPEVYRWWRGEADMSSEVAADLADPDASTLAVELDGRVVGAIQWSAEAEPDYHHASIDIYLDPTVHGRGASTVWSSTLRRTTPPLSGATPRWASARLGSCAATSAAQMARGTTGC